MEQISIEETKSIINTIFQQASAGKFEFASSGSFYNSPWFFFTKFYAKVGNRLLKNGEDIFDPQSKHTPPSEDDFKTPIFQIPNVEAFALLTQAYLNIATKFFLADKEYFSYSDEAFKEKLFLDLLANTTNYDRNNILSYIEMRTKMLENELQTGHFLLNQSSGFSVKTMILKNKSMLEGPYRFTPYFLGENEEKFFLPSITFALVDDTVHIFVIQAKKEKQTGPLAKKLDRYFRKVNKDVDMEDIIGQVSPNALISLTLFLSIMQKEGIKNVIAPNFMPVRYLINLNGEENYFNREKKGLDEETSLEEITEKHNRQQFGITNKFTYTLLRYCHHFDGCEFDYNSIKEQLEIQLENKHTPQDNIIFDIDKTCKAPLGVRNKSKEK